MAADVHGYPRRPRPRRAAADGGGVQVAKGSARVRETAEKWFGHRELLPGQEEAVSTLLDGRDVLLVAPTGSGKSLTYQVAGILLGGCTLVVSPLLALQQDQVASLQAAGLTAARLSSAESDT